MSGTRFDFGMSTCSVVWTQAIEAWARITEGGLTVEAVRRLVI